MSRLLFSIFIFLSCSSTARAAASYDGYRWFQVEISIFSNDFPEYRNSEYWSPERLNLVYPEPIREFAQLADFFRIENLEQKMFGSPSTLSQEDASDDSNDILLAAVADTGPFAANPHGDLRLPDIEREAFYLLPDDLSDFQTTNARLENSPNNRLLFHGLWRQPVVQPDQASALLIRGGNQYGNHHELEGSITIRFNQNEDRVVIDTDLWLAEFTTGQVDQPWSLPELPSSLADPETATSTDEYNISRIVQMKQSRDMRSYEFHYLDNPSLGVVIMVFAYDLPPRMPLNVPAIEQNATDIPAGTDGN